MSEVFTNRAGRTWATHLGSPDGQPTMGGKKTEPSAARSWSGAPSGPGPAPAAFVDASNPSEPSRIRIDVPMGTSYLEIQASIFRQAWQLAGTQLRAAIALGLTPETISRALRACDRKRIASPRIPKAWPAVEDNRVIGSSGHRAISPSDHGSIGSSVHRIIEPSPTQPDDQPMDQWADEPIDEPDELQTDD